MTKHRVLHTLFAAALLLGAAPALADAGSGHPCEARCSCAARAAAPAPGAERRAAAPAGQSEEEFLRQVWSAP